MCDLITVVVPVYHVEKYLERCIESICCQTYTNLEIILVDDGSDDKCPEICDLYCTKDSRIQVIHQKNSGLSMARNVGIEHAKGNYIAFVDSDDCISKYYIEYLYRALKECKSNISQCGYVEFDNYHLPNFEENYTIPKVWTKMNALKNQITPNTNIVSTVAWNKLYDISLFKSIRYPAGKLHEDEFTTYKILDKISKMAYIDIALYGYFQNQDGIMHSPTKSAHIDALEAKLEKYNYYKNKGYDQLLPLSATDFFDSLLVLTRKMNHALDKEMYKERIQKCFVDAKNSLDTSHLNRSYRFILSKATTPKQVIQYYSIYLKLGKCSKLLQISKIKSYVFMIRKKNTDLKRIRNLFTNYVPSQTVFMLGTVEYENIGDQAIGIAQKNFIHTCLPDHTIIEIPESLFNRTRRKLKALIKSESIITIPGGGNMGDVWFDDEKRRRFIIADYPNNKIIVFPQTIDYSDTLEGKKSLQDSILVYNNHKHLILCAREQISFEQMRKYYPKCTILLVPDIVLSLTRSFNCKRNGVLVCFRDDKEKQTSPRLLDEIREAARVCDFQYQYTDTVSLSRFEIQNRDTILTNKLNEFASSKLVITDRLHGMIFAFITGTPCLVLPNTNHKVKGVFDMWLSKYTFVRFMKDLRASDIVKMYNNVDQLKTNQTINAEQFKLLKEVLIGGKNEKTH